MYLEYSGVLSMVLIWRLAFNPRERGVLLVVNWLAIAIPALLTSQLAGTPAARLKRTNLQLRDSERQRESLTNLIVHDLRNPLTGLMGGLDVLRVTLPKELTADQQRLLDISRRNSQVLLDMISELLNISKLEAGQLKLNVQPVDLLQLIVKSVDSVSVLTDIEQLTIKTRLAEVKPVPCDRQRISRVMANLLSNAIKHTPPGGTITMETRPSNDKVTVSVADTGEGIPVKYQQRIFDKFGQVEKPGEERLGTGLGLTFCKMTVEAHGGQIWVESRPGQGSTFFSTLPCG
jgi:signal transduction histidine kinase